MGKQKLIVIDSSVAVKWVNAQNEELLNKADKLLQQLQDNKIKIFMPELAKYEIGNALLYKRMNLSQTKAAVTAFYAIPIEFILEDTNLAQETIEIAQTNKITYYDASFIALARKLKASLITVNPRHHKKYKARDIKIISLKDIYRS